MQCAIRNRLSTHEGNKMPDIEVCINPGVSRRTELEAALREQLQGFDKLRTATTTRPSKPGTLAFPGTEVIAFVVQHRDAIKTGAEATLALRAILNACQYVVDWIKPTAEKQKPVVVNAYGCSVGLPASRDSQHKFLKAVGQQISGEADTAQKPTSQQVSKSKSKRNKKNK